MTLIIILLAIAVEQFVGVTAELRQLTWFENYTHWLENKIGHQKIWNGAFGVIITLAIPLLVLVLVFALLNSFSLLFSFLISLLILIYSLGHHCLNNELDEYTSALEDDDAARINQLESELLQSDDEDGGEQGFIETVFVNTNERLFGVLLWFLLLGPMGALLYRLTIKLRDQQTDIHGSYADSARDLCNILNWLPARLLALGNALSGNLVDAVEAWRDSEHESLQVNEEVIKTSGLGALQYRPGISSIDESITNERLYWMQALQGLLNRTLFIWLTIVGLVSIAGWIG